MNDFSFFFFPFSIFDGVVQKQCQIGVLPLGTGNDLARVIGWGSVCDDDAHLPQLLERYEKASVKMLDRCASSFFFKIQKKFSSAPVD
jgi:diacylglycerol kinase family enzyme